MDVFDEGEAGPEGGSSLVDEGEEGVTGGVRGLMPSPIYLPPQPVPEGAPRSSVCWGCLLPLPRSRSPGRCG